MASQPRTLNAEPLNLYSRYIIEMINMNKRRFDPLVLALLATVILIPQCLASNAADEAVTVKTSVTITKKISRVMSAASLWTLGIMEMRHP